MMNQDFNPKTGERWTYWPPEDVAKSSKLVQDLYGVGVNGRGLLLRGVHIEVPILNALIHIYI